MADQGKNKNMEPKTSLRIHNRDYDTIIEDPEDPFNPEKILFPFVVEEKLYCFVSPLMSKEEAEKKANFVQWFDRLEPSKGGHWKSQGEDITYETKPESDFEIEWRNSYGDFLSLHMGKPNEPITDKEHVAFLIYWLNAVLFCSSSVTM
ncbi:hypothetical protein PIB30_046843 [Stylosanthes scabra]|uniref:Aminotransferase-like plant mobile domain-containing protein n=1 Tax=Stylosanthes scabra TaxID=79078 RepID=A0ABU6WGX1_9FABA|nr:hypothetical protein [Stylosanthes scabra]